MTQPAEPAEKLQALRRAITEVFKSLLTDVGDDDVAAITCVMDLEDALSDLSGLLGLTPRLLEIASLGPRVEERVATRRDEVRRQHADLVAQRAALEADRELSRQLDQIKSEKEQIAARIAELQRVKQIMGELPTLRATLSTLEETIAAEQESEAGQITGDLAAAIRAIAGLTARQRSALGAELSATTEELETTTRQTAEQRAQLADLTVQLAAQVAEAQELKVAAEQELPALQLHLQADADLVSGLDAADLGDGGARTDRVKSVLADAEQRLADLDSKLRPLLNAHASTYEQARQLRR
jgi:DNA repair exonuclease SbcCD ATPase subunit